MTTRPLPLPGWAIKALAEERLTQWRWRLKPSSVSETWPRTMWFQYHDGKLFGESNEDPCVYTVPTADGGAIHCGAVRYVPGDKFWVQETWARVPRTAYLHSDGIEQTDDPSDPDMAAIYKQGFDRSRGGIVWRSPVTMPRRFSRWTLAVEEVRAERVAELRFDDAPALGGHRLPIAALHAFQDYWESRHGHGAWERNDWCAVAVWRAERRNVDG